MFCLVLGISEFNYIWFVAVAGAGAGAAAAAAATGAAVVVSSLFPTCAPTYRQVLFIYSSPDHPVGSQSDDSQRVSEKIHSIGL